MVQKILLYRFVFSRASSLTEKIELRKRALDRYESCPQLGSYGWQEENHIVSLTSSRNNTPSYRNYHSHLKDERCTVKPLSSILQNYGKRHEDGIFVEDFENENDTYNPEIKGLYYSIYKTVPKNTLKRLISLQEVVSKAHVNNYNGLEFADPVLQITKSFKTSVPEANNDFFEKTVTVNCDASLNC